MWEKSEKFPLGQALSLVFPASGEKEEIRSHVLKGDIAQFDKN